MQMEASKSNYAVIMLVFSILLLLMVVVSLGMGRLYIAPVDVFKILCSYVVPLEQSWSDQAASVIYTLRLPRVLAAILIGAALSLSGAAYQSVLKPACSSGYAWCIIRCLRGCIALHIVGLRQYLYPDGSL